MYLDKFLMLNLNQFAQKKLVKRLRSCTIPFSFRYNSVTIPVPIPVPVPDRSESIFIFPSPSERDREWLREQLTFRHHSCSRS